MPTLAELNRKHQLTYRNKLKERLGIEEYNKMHTEKVKSYRRKRQEAEQLLNPTPPKPIISPKSVEIPEITTTPKEQPNGLKYSVESKDVTPSYITRDTPLQPRTIIEYISKSNLINKLMLEKPLTETAKNELLKLFKNESFNHETILNELTYLNDTETVVKTLRSKHSNDSSFKNYIIVLTVIMSHFPTLHEMYMRISKLTKQVRQDIDDKRDENVNDKPEKIIDLSNRQELLNNAYKLENVNDVMIYAIQILIPPRRLENRLIVITDETDKDKLINNNNYLIIKDEWRLVYNEYKSAKSLKQQVINVPDDLKHIMTQYIAAKSLVVGDYLFSQSRNKQKLISASNFSNKIRNVFNKVYGVDISNKYIRCSAATNAQLSNMSKKDRTKLAHDMGHSLTENLSYSKHMSQNNTNT